MRDEQHLVIVRQGTNEEGEPVDVVEERAVEVVRREADTVLIAQGLNEGERVCVSFLPIFRPEMEVEVVEFNEPESDGG